MYGAWLFNSILDQHYKEIWKKTMAAVIKSTRDGHPSDELLAFYLDVHNDYKVNIQNQL